MRRENGEPWTQGDLARALPGTVEASSVSRWENGKVRPSDDMLEAIAKAVERDVGYFMAPEPVNGSADLIGVLGEPSQLDRIEAMLAELLSLAKRPRDPFGLVAALEDPAPPESPSDEPQATEEKPSRRRRAG